VLLDGGIRRGTDILKAIALGASSVLVGRAALWGLCCGGEAGVHHALAILRAELDLAMALCGARTLREITPDLVAQ
jgi:4-hydroxymandelate oxidase